MHFLLAGRVRWRMLRPSAIGTGVVFGGWYPFSKICSACDAVKASYGTIGTCDHFGGHDLV